MTKAYKLSIVYYLIFSILLLLSAYMLFEYKIGFGYENIIDYYLGNEERFIPAKSAAGILKLILPHTFVFGLFIMVLLHFLVFTEHRYKKRTLTLIYASFFIAFLEMLTPFAIISGFGFFAYIKLFSFFSLLSSILYISWLLFCSIAFD